MRICFQGLIASDKGWNIYVGGNGGTRPRHATIFATDVPPSKVVRCVVTTCALCKTPAKRRLLRLRYIDRYLMYYIQTADRLQRTAPWLDALEGGIEKLRRVIIDDELGICHQLDKDMDALVGTFECEWTRVVNEPERWKQFRQHVNTVCAAAQSNQEPRADDRVNLPQAEGTVNIERITERDQSRAADWPKEFEPVRMTTAMIKTPQSEWTWQKVAKLSDLTPTDTATTSCSVKLGDSQIAIFSVPKKGLFATQQMCPHKRAFVLDHGIIGDDKEGNVVGSSIPGDTSRTAKLICNVLALSMYRVRCTSEDIT